MTVLAFHTLMLMAIAKQIGMKQEDIDHLEELSKDYDNPMEE